MSSNITKSIPDLNLPTGISQTNVHQVELSDEDVSIEFISPIIADGTSDLNLTDEICQTSTHQMEFNEDAFVEFTAPIRGNGTSDLSLPDEIFQSNTHQIELFKKNVLVELTVPISGDGAVVPSDTENLLFEQNMHQVEVPAQDPSIAFTAPISRDVDHASGVTDVAAALVSTNTEKLLLKKRRNLWKVAESFDACRKIPQDPHFLPLKSCSNIIREGQALAKMVIFDNIARNTSNLRLDTEREVINDDLSLLDELETHGLNVAPLKNILNKTLLLKNEMEKFENMLEQTKKRLIEHDQDKCKNKEKKTKIEKRMKELQKEIELAAKMEKAREAKIAAELMAQKVHGEKLYRIKIQFEELVTALLH